jgi:hypothetical protein
MVTGEITFKLHSKWDENLLNENSATFKILEGNVKKAVSINYYNNNENHECICKDDIS